MAFYSVAEFNTIITMLGCLCAVVQAATGGYAAGYKKKISLLKTNDILFRAHRAFGGFATTLYFLGLFAGLSGLFGTLTQNSPPMEMDQADYNIHTWGSFAVMVVIIWKTYISYFKKGSIYKKGRYLGIATFLAWAFTWITSAIAYYERTIPPNIQHEPPWILLPYDLMWFQIILPFLIGFFIALPIMRSAMKLELKKEQKSVKLEK